MVREKENNMCSSGTVCNSQELTALHRNVKGLYSLNIEMIVMWNDFWLLVEPEAMIWGWEFEKQGSRQGMLLREIGKYQ